MSANTRLKALVTVIFAILYDIVKNNSELDADVQNLEEQINKGETLQEIELSDIERYEAQIKEITDRKLKPSSINIDGWD